MKIQRIRRLNVMACLVLLLFCAQAAGKDGGITPGRKIGRIEIGMTRQIVHGKLGRPSGTYKLLGRGYKGDYWHSQDNENTLRVFYDRNDRVYQISATSPGFNTSEGISTRSSLAEVKRQYPNLKVLRVAARGDIDYYYDSRKGVAFVFTERLEENGSAMRLYAIQVFKLGGSPQPEPDELLREN
jgi:hypothetical protein